jgi:hypothetical protein
MRSIIDVFDISLLGDKAFEISNCARNGYDDGSLSLSLSLTHTHTHTNTLEALHEKARSYKEAAVKQ